MSDNIDKQMKAKGYIKAEGVAIIGDIAVTETKVTNQILSPTLKNKECVDLFNNEMGEGWQLYRKVGNSY